MEKSDENIDMLNFELEVILRSAKTLYEASHGMLDGKDLHEQRQLRESKIENILGGASNNVAV